MLGYVDMSLGVSGTTSTLICVASSLVIILMAKKLRDDLQKHASKKYPPAPRAMPVIGHLHLLSKYQENPWEGFDSFRKEFGDIVGLRLGVHPAVMVSSGELMREVLLAKGDIFCNRPKFERYNRIFGGDRDNSLALCDWSELQRVRRLVAQLGILPRFGSKLYTQLDSCIQKDIRPYVSQVLAKSSGKTLRKPDLLFMCANIFTNYLCSTRFEASDSEYLKILYIYDYVFFDINQCYGIDFMPFLAKLGVGRSYVNDLVTKCNTLRKYMEATLLTPRAAKYSSGRDSAHVNLDDDGDSVMADRDFLDLSLQHHFDDPKAYPWDVNVYEVLDLIGGHSAVGNLMMRLLGFLAMNPECQDEIAKEAKAALVHEPCEDTDGHGWITLDHKQRMPYTEAAIFETLRLASSPIVPHVASKDTTIQGFDVDEGTMVMFNSYHLNMSDKYWDSPRTFNPKRFLTKNSNQNNNEDLVYQIYKPENFFPFSCGRRACLGYKLVTTITFSTVANICLKYRMSPKNLDDVAKQLVPKGSLALCPDNTFELTLEERSD